MFENGPSVEEKGVGVVHDNPVHEITQALIVLEGSLKIYQDLESSRMFYTSLRDRISFRYRPPKRKVSASSVTIPSTSFSRSSSAHCASACSKAGFAYAWCMN